MGNSLNAGDCGKGEKGVTGEPARVGSNGRTQDRGKINEKVGAVERELQVSERKGKVLGPGKNIGEMRL